MLRRVDLARTIRRQRGVISTSQALECGLTEDALRWRVATGAWTRIGRGVYRAQTGELDWAGRAHAAVLRGGEGCALSLRAAEHAWGVVEKAPPVIVVAVPRGRRVTRLPGTRFRCTPVLDVVRRAGLPVTSAEQTVLDLGDEETASWRDAVAAAARWVQRRRTTAPRLAAALESRPRHRHRRVLQVALRTVSEGAESVLEFGYVQRVEMAHGLPRARMQVSGERGHGTRRDFEYEAFGVVVEVDGRLGHEGEWLFVDRRRDRRVAASGRVTMRAGWVDVEADACELAVD
ncbi:MAG: type IV toxin-antitoxin system AbiEi family antitoxin domain-containing protein, partial [Dermatophilaceae bacterium]